MQLSRGHYGLPVAVPWASCGPEEVTTTARTRKEYLLLVVPGRDGLMGIAGLGLWAPRAWFLLLALVPSPAVTLATVTAASSMLGNFVFSAQTSRAEFCPPN